MFYSYRFGGYSICELGTAGCVEVYFYMYRCGGSIFYELDTAGFVEAYWLDLELWVVWFLHWIQQAV
jgi:hypothetical protein